MIELSPVMSSDILLGFIPKEIQAQTNTERSNFRHSTSNQTQDDNMAKRWNPIALEAHGSHDVMFVQEEKHVVPGVLRKLATERSLETLEQARLYALRFWRETVEEFACSKHFVFIK